MIKVWEDEVIKDLKQCGVKVGSDSLFYECLYCEDTGDLILSEYIPSSFDIDDITEFGSNDLDFTYINGVLLCKLSGIDSSILIGNNKYDEYYCSVMPPIESSITVFNVMHGKKSLGIFSNLSKAKNYIIFNVHLNDGDVYRVPDIVSQNDGNVLYEDFKEEILYISMEKVR